MSDIRNDQRPWALISVPRTAASPRAAAALGAAALLLVVSVTGSIPHPAQAAAKAGSNPVAEVEALEHELMKLYSNDPAHNVDKIMEYFYDGPEMLQFDLMTPREFAGADFRKHFAELAVQYNGVVEIIDMRTRANENLAFVSNLQHTYGKDPSGKPFDLTFRVTDCLIKVAGKWKILHEHVSVPIDMATSKADFQSKK
jgi:ketosteroid isomerase-like protein